ncbi:DUF58 domain-containing protein [Pelagibacterium mangrovi]|uniref:DUF58 domain-containing protein n=1 Tax=Pelagibacterium mangrovi TaxID=3119828 RepID=UPI002FCBCECF
MRPPSHLLDRLKRDRLRLHMAKPSTGFGERRSRQKGVGLEFAESRPFREGDDLKNLDPRLSVRTGESYIREFFFERRASVQIVLDTSASMMWPDGSKLELGKLMANVMGFVALISGDAVQIVSSNRACPHFSPWFQGERRSHALFDHLDQITPDCDAPFAALMDGALSFLKRKGLIILIGDFLEERLPDFLRAIAHGDKDIILIDLTHKDERNAPLSPGAYSLIGSEEETPLTLSLDPNLRSLYQQEFAAWKEQIRTQTIHHGGRHMTLSAPFDGRLDALTEQLHFCLHDRD